MGCANLISVYTTKNPGEAEIVRLALEENGILAAIQGGVQAGLTGALDIDVMVRAEDIVRARDFIAEHQSFSPPDESEESAGVGDDDKPR